MKLKYLICSVFVIVILLFSISAMASMLIPANDHAEDNSRAPDHSPVIDENGDIERVDFIHYAQSSKPAASKARTCYKLLGYKWNTLPVSYVINPTNPQGLDVNFVTSAVSSAAETWDARTSAELFSDSYSLNYTVAYGTYDYNNAISFGDYPNSDVIAVTSIWFIRAGRRIVEFDVLFNTRFSWGDATFDNSLMDLQNIATHELGHGIGLGDIYTGSCSAVTMYGYSYEGDTDKRTLEQPDVTGLQLMYGG